MLDEYNFDPDYSVKCIEANRHNHITATYCLIFKKALKQNKTIIESGGMHGSIDRNANTKH